MNRHLLLFDEKHHYEALELLSVQALADDDLESAFKYIDRRCRISPLAQCQHYTLRAEILYRMGYKHLALKDIESALSLTPDDLSANQRRLAWGEDNRKIDSARILIDHDNDFGVLAEAIKILRRLGQTFFVSCKPTYNTISGWAVWRGAKSLTITIDGDELISKKLLPDATHPLNSPPYKATTFEIKRPQSSKTQNVLFFLGANVIHRLQLRPNISNSKMAFTPNKPPTTAPQSVASVSIIVPVYADFDATKACLDSVVTELAVNKRSKLIIVDDASKDKKIKNYLKHWRSHPQITLLTNQTNLGFIGAVNRALLQAAQTDVILLNSDTLVPPGFSNRLADAAYSSPDIGTVTPLSNNGEYTSFPVPFETNPLGSYAEICLIDKIAAAVNLGKIVDIPVGIGFCLYIKRTCLDTIELLSDVYYRGYMEDAELCLRARELGFRNVCTTSIYVGHVGSRSFGAEKRALVVKNLKTLEQRFPEYRKESAVFIQADPIAPCRTAIQRKLPVTPGATLLVTGAGLVKDVVEQRASDLTSTGANVLVLELGYSASSHYAKLTNPVEQYPKSASFNISNSVDLQELETYLGKAKLSRTEIADPANIQQPFLNLLLKLDIPIDLLIVDAGLVCARGNALNNDGTPCDGIKRRRPCLSCREISYKSSSYLGNHSGIEWWPPIIEKADRILTFDPFAKAFCWSLIPNRKIISLQSDSIPAPSVRSLPTKRKDGTVGFVPISKAVSEFRLMQTTAHALNTQNPGSTIIILGETFCDIDLMKLDNVFVTGPLEIEDYEDLLAIYDIQAIFIPLRQPLFGHPRWSNLMKVSACPISYFDWSLGARPARSQDLALDPFIDSTLIAPALIDWLVGN